MSKISDYIRKTFTEGDERRDAGLTTPEDVVRRDDIPYGPDPAWQSLDVYRPRASAGEALPVIISVHGGGWVYGDKERYQFYCMDLCRRGFAVVNFTYRLAPEFKFPSSLEDTNAVFAWVLAHGEEYGFDTGHVFAVGDSAGGNLLGLYAALCTNPAYAAFFDFDPPAGFAPAAVALNCGAYNMMDDRTDQTLALMADLMPRGGTPEELRLAAVTEHVTPAFPPTFLMTSTGDFLPQQAFLMAETLGRARVPFTFNYYGDSVNRLPHVFHCNIRTEDARRCNDDECAFFRSFLGKKG